MMIRHRLLNRRTLAGVVLAMVTIILAAACGTATGEAEPTQPQNRTETIQVYYGNADGTELVQAEKTIIFQDESDKYKAALEQMRETKQNEHYSLFPNMEILSVSLEDGLLTLDISIPEGDRWGAGSEQLAIDALVKTMYQFEEIAEIQILLNGEKVDSLMGHVELPNPIKRP